MASRFSKGGFAETNGILDITEEGQIFIEADDRDIPEDLSVFLKDFDGKDVTITVNYRVEL